MDIGELAPDVDAAAIPAAVGGDAGGVTRIDVLDQHGPAVPGRMGPGVETSIPHTAISSASPHASIGGWWKEGFTPWSPIGL